MKLGLIGYPVSHSKSSWIHQQFLDQIGVTGDYQRIEIEPNQFDLEIEQLKLRQLTGFNVTIPYKEKIIPYLDEISPAAAEIGAVNTVICEDGKWLGHNTDGLGLVTALKARYPDLFTGEKSALILGAGGASRGIYHALLIENFADISIANRTISRAETLLDMNKSGIRGDALTFSEAEAKLDHYDLIIQTTSVGMTPNSEAQVLDLTQLKRGTVISDIVYQPFWTTLLEDANRRGGRIHHGHEMLLYQAKLAFELWSRQSVDACVLLETFESMLTT